MNKVYIRSLYIERNESIKQTKTDKRYETNAAKYIFQKLVLLLREKKPMEKCTYTYNPKLHAVASFLCKDNFYLIIFGLLCLCARRKIGNVALNVI